MLRGHNTQDATKVIGHNRFINLVFSKVNLTSTRHGQNSLPYGRFSEACFGLGSFLSRTHMPRYWFQTDTTDWRLASFNMCFQWLQAPFGNQTWQLDTPYKWRFDGKSRELSIACLITGGYINHYLIPTLPAWNDSTKRHHSFNRNRNSTGIVTLRNMYRVYNFRKMSCEKFPWTNFGRRSQLKLAI